MLQPIPHELTIILFFPILSAPIAYLLGRIEGKYARWFAIIVTLVEFLLTLHLALAFNIAKSNELQFVEYYDWVPQFGIYYLVGVDGLSLVMVLLTAILSLAAAIGSNHIEEREGFYYFLFLLMETSIIGVFISFNLFLFYIFWEMVLVPMYFLIAIWGGPRRKYAAIKFFIYTHVGGVVMLISFFYAYWIYYLNTGVFTFNLYQLIGLEPINGGYAAVASFLPRDIGLILFGALFFGFAIKVPVVPLHTWLPDAHVEAPSPISVILAGLLLKMGGYGIIRIAIPMIPFAAKELAWPITILALINIFYAGFVALWQADFKRLVAYSSISHMGIVVLGSIVGNVEGLTGAIFMMFAHGLINGLLFLLAGVYKHHLHTRIIEEIGGYTTYMPLASAFLVVGELAGLGLPGLAAFVAEFLTILGAFKTWGLRVAVVVFGPVLSAGYILWAVQRIVFGPSKTPHETIKDLCLPEIIFFTILTFLIVLLGVYPRVLTDITAQFTSFYISKYF